MFVGVTTIQQKMGVRMAEKLYKISELSEILSAPRATVWYWVNNGEFPNAKKQNPYADTSPILVPQSDLDAFLLRRKRWSVSNGGEV